jgi:hypothetical protein
MLIEFFTQNAGANTRLIQMLRAGKGTPNDIFTKDTIVSSEPFSGYQHIIPKGSTLIQAVLLCSYLYEDPECRDYNKAQENFNELIFECYRQGAAKDNEITLKYSLEKFKIFRAGCSNRDLHSVAILYIKYLYKYYLKPTKDKLEVKPRHPGNYIDITEHFVAHDDKLDFYQVMNALEKDERLQFIKLLSAELNSSFFNSQNNPTHPNAELWNSFLRHLTELFDSEQITEIKNHFVTKLQFEAAQVFSGIPIIDLVREYIKYYVSFDLSSERLQDYDGLERCFSVVTIDATEIQGLFPNNPTLPELVNLICGLLIMSEHNLVYNNRKVTLVCSELKKYIFDNKHFANYKADPNFRLALLRILLDHDLQMSTDLFITIFKKLSEVEIQKISKTLVYSHNYSKKLVNFFAVVRKVNLTDMSGNIVTHLLTFNNIVMSFSNSGFSKILSSIPQQLQFAIEQPLYANQIPTGTLSSILGRTILLQQQDYICAIKILKRGENKPQLEKQLHSDKYLLSIKETLQLRGEIPTQQFMLQIANLESTLNQLKVPLEQQRLLRSMVAVDHADATVAYVYCASRDYFSYLSSAALSIQEFHVASITAINDMLILFKAGMVFTQLADLYHDTDRPYIAVGKRSAGKLANWQAAVRYPNLRKSTGLADSGDVCSISEYNPDADGMEITGAAKIHEYIGRLLLIIQLCGAAGVIERCKLNQLSQNQRDVLWRQLSISLKYIHRFTFNKIAELLEVQIPVTLFEHGCNYYEYLARQMGFWCDSARHWQYLSINTLPTNLYQPPCITDIDEGTSDLEFRLFCGEIEPEAGINGYHVKGQHLGFENGLYPLDIRAHYLVSALPSLLAPVYQMSRQRLTAFKEYNNSTDVDVRNLSTETREQAATAIQTWYRAKMH